jgi:mono/diheme cytochrome c family protein
MRESLHPAPPRDAPLRTAVVRFCGYALAALLAAVPSDGLRAQAQDPEARSTLDGVFTAEQAARGRQTYIDSCTECHALDWARGDVVRSWEGAPLYGFFELLNRTMPESNPGSLSRRDYVDIIAYMLQVNGMPPGDQALSTGTSRLRQIIFRWSDNP